MSSVMYQRLYIFFGPSSYHKYFKESGMEPADLECQSLGRGMGTRVAGRNGWRNGNGMGPEQPPLSPLNAKAGHKDRQCQ